MRGRSAFVTGRSVIWLLGLWLGVDFEGGCELESAMFVE